MEQKLRKLMLREMKTEVVGDTVCINHDYQKKAVLDLNIDRGLHDEEICKECGAVRPLDPFDNNTVEVD